jgi:RNA polymerase sigma factor (TIGR02999 family)
VIRHNRGAPGRQGANRVDDQRLRIQCPLVGRVAFQHVRRVRRRARGRLRRERPDHSLSPTALVNETYLKLIDQRRVQWQSRAHFFGVAGQAMRRILVDHARARRAVKREAGTRVSWREDLPAPGPQDLDVLALDAALDKLAALDARKGRLVELRFFAGLTIVQAAAVLGLAQATANRDWVLARAWLFRELRGDTA